MHPAKSIILFTTLSGMGNGLLAFLCLGIPDVSGWTAFIFFAIAFVLAGGGLLASTFHLGHPERFLKAFTQWRSSWLSREGCIACLTFAFAGVYALLVIFYDTRIMVLGWVAAALTRRRLKPTPQQSRSKINGCQENSKDQADRLADPPSRKPAQDPDRSWAEQDAQSR